MDRDAPAGWDATQLVVAEYTYLRTEVIKLMELQFQNIAVTVLAFGTVLSVGFQARNAAIILVYPLLSLILSIVWLHHANLIARIAAYVRTDVEDRVGYHYLGWEHFVRGNPLPRRHLAYWGMRAIFVASSILAILASLMVPGSSIPLNLLRGLAFAVTALTGVVFAVWAEPSPELSGGES
jgi:hypothetical protein